MVFGRGFDSRRLHQSSCGRSFGAGRFACTLARMTAQLPDPACVQAASVAAFRLSRDGDASTLPRPVNTPDDLRGRLDEIRDRIAAAAQRSGRPADAVTLVGVAKTVPVERVRQAIACGLADIGENRVQEAGRVIETLGRTAARWHLIGHLQRNKGARALDLFDRVHTLDSLELAGQLSQLAIERGRRVAALVQVNVSGEATKSGVEPGEFVALLERLLPLGGLAIDGLMAIGTPVDRPDDARPEFARLRGLRDAAESALGVSLPQLSMGMSDDYEAAVEEGSTMVRVGSALFGTRPAPAR